MILDSIMRCRRLLAWMATNARAEGALAGRCVKWRLHPSEQHPERGCDQPEAIARQHVQRRGQRFAGP